MKKSLIIVLIVLIVVAAVLALLLATNIFKNHAPAVSQQAAASASATLITQQSTQQNTPISSVPQEPSSTFAPTSTSTPSPSPSSSTKHAEDIVDYTNNTIKYEYYDVSDDITKTGAEQLSKQQTLIYPLTLVAKQYFARDLAQSPLNPNSIELKGNALYIDFPSALTDVEMGSLEESAMLKTIGSIYLQNVSGLTSVYISVDGQDYSSGHIHFPKDTPYMTK